MPLRVDRPPYHKIRSEYARGMSWTQLGKKYGIDPRTLYGYTRRDAKRAGDTWPIRRASERELLDRLDAYDRCPALGVRLELREFQAWSGVEFKDIAREAGLHKTTIHKITAGIKTTVTRETRDKIMAVIVQYERKRDGHGDEAVA